MKKLQTPKNPQKDKKNKVYSMKFLFEYNIKNVDSNFSDKTDIL